MFWRKPGNRLLKGLAAAALSDDEERPAGMSGGGGGFIIIVIIMGLRLGLANIGFAAPIRLVRLVSGLPEELFIRVWAFIIAGGVDPLGIFDAPGPLVALDFFFFLGAVIVIFIGPVVVVGVS